jgi:hypothetical protein
MKTIFKGKKYADYYTFYLQDQASKQDYDLLWNEDSSTKMLAVGEQVIGIGTKRYEFVPVNIKLYVKAPLFKPENCEKANECSLHISSVAVLGSVISGFEVLDLPPGNYRVRILYKNLSTVENDWKGKDSYWVQLWAEARLREVVRLKG